MDALPAQVDIALRRLGWDIDPGWIPRLGRIVQFHYVRGFDTEATSRG